MIDRLMHKYINAFILAIFGGAGVLPIFLMRHPELLKSYWWLAVLWEIGAVAFGIWAYRFTKEIHASGQSDPDSRSTFRQNLPSALVVLMVVLFLMGVGIGFFVKR